MAYSRLAALMMTAAMITLCLAPAISPSLAHKKRKRGPSKYTIYFHNRVYNPAVNNTNFTSVYSAPPPGNFSNPYNFGVLSTFEVPLTAQPSNTSASVGVGNGFWLLDSQQGYVLFHVFTATINDGTYNGTITIMGQMVESLPVRILTIVGGTGDFLLARGFAKDRLIAIDHTPPAYWTVSFELQLWY